MECESLLAFSAKNVTSELNEGPSYVTSHMKEVPKCPKLVIKQTLLLCQEFEGV